MDHRVITPPRVDVFVRSLSACAELSPEEMAFLEAMPLSLQDAGIGAELLREGQLLAAPQILLSGWACRFRMLPDGRRQIFDFILPGDLFGVYFGPGAVALSTAVTLTVALTADASPLWAAVRDRADEFPGLANCCRAAVSLAEARLLDQLMRVGRQTAYERTASLILEFFHRLRHAGLAEGDVIPMPLTQETIADALGLSVVHLNRTLQQLRRDRLIESRNGFMRVLDPEQLAKISDFRPPPVPVRRLK